MRGGGGGGEKEGVREQMGEMGERKERGGRNGELKKEERLD